MNCEPAADRRLLSQVHLTQSGLQLLQTPACTQAMAIVETEILRPAAEVFGAGAPLADCPAALTQASP